jgi:hypothetical protein
MIEYVQLIGVGYRKFVGSRSWSKGFGVVVLPTADIGHPEKVCGDGAPLLPKLMKLAAD